MGSCSSPGPKWGQRIGPREQLAERRDRAVAGARQ